MTDERQNGKEQSKIGKVEVGIGEQREAITRTEMPLRVLVLGDFTPDAPKIDDWQAPSRLINITPRDFQSVMQELSPHLTINVPNRLSNNPKELTIELSFPNIQAFRPSDIAQQVDELSGLLQIRQLVSQLKDGKLTLQEFDQRFQQTGMDPAWLEQFHQLISPPQAPVAPEPQESKPTTAPKPEEDTLDSLLSMVDTSDEQAGPDGRSSEAIYMDSLIRAVIGTRKGGPKADKSVVETVIDELDRTLSDQVNEVLHHNKFQQLEAAWRGLKFLMDRVDFQENIRLEILSAHKAELRDAIYHQVFTPEYNELIETPLSVMVADYEFSQSPEDIELLGDIAKVAASINVPFIASVGPVFFGLQTAAELVKLPLLGAHFQRPEYAQWNVLRADEDAQYISLILSRFLLRFPYGPESIQAKEFKFVERIESSGNYLWGRGVFILGAAMVRSFMEVGWCVRITGLRGGGVVENLPMRPYRAAGREVSIPLEVLFTSNKEKEFMDAGFVILSSRINDDKACILGAPTVYRPRQYTTAEENIEARLHATLPYQLFASRMAHCLQRITKEVSTGLTAEQLQDAFTAKLRSVLAKPGVEMPFDAVIVAVSDNTEKPDYYDVILRVKPPFQILGQDADLLLELQTRR